jgi:hypothetical protein
MERRPREHSAHGAGASAAATSTASLSAKPRAQCTESSSPEIAPASRVEHARAARASRFSLSVRGRRPTSQRAQRPLRVLLITDPGPDPDDIKALLVLWHLHTQGILDLVGVCCNGGGEPTARAALARCVLDTLGATRVPVAVGSVGEEYASMPHEYRLPGYADDGALPLERGDELIERVLRESPPASLVVVCISSLRDAADAIRMDAKLVRERVCRFAIMGGLKPDPASPYGYAPDTSVNNEFDRDAAAFVYDWCFAQGVPMSVVSRHAVPLLPMQLARSFAERTACPVMRYLADAQFLGLEGLWQKLCAGKLPARCSKQWYFETFCGVDGAVFAQQQLDTLGADEPIVPRLNGFVKPYDVVALLAALPSTLNLFDVSRAEVAVRAANGASCTHLLLLGVEHMLDVEHVQRILRDTYHEVVLASGAPDASSIVGCAQQERSRSTHPTVSTVRSASRGCARTTRSSSAMGAAIEFAAGTVKHALPALANRAARPSFKPVVAAEVDGAIASRLRGGGADGLTGASELERTVSSSVVTRNANGLLDVDLCARLLSSAQLELRRNELAVYQQCAALLTSAMATLAGLALWAAARAPTERVAGRDDGVAQLGHACALVGYLVLLATIGMLQPIRAHGWSYRAVYALVVLALGAIAALGFGGCEWRALRACGRADGASAAGCDGASATIIHLSVACAHALVALALVLGCRAVERRPEAAQRALWNACGCHFAARATQLLSELVRLCGPRQPCASSYGAALSTGDGALKLALLLELALLAVLVAWPGSLARARASSARLIARLGARRSARARVATHAPLGLTALLNFDFVAGDARPECVAEGVCERLRKVEASAARLRMADFGPDARARLWRAPASARGKAAAAEVPLSAAGVRLVELRLRSAFSRRSQRVQPVGTAVAPIIAVIDVTPSPAAASPLRLPRLKFWLAATAEASLPEHALANVAFDYYVVHSWSDDASLKASALERWAAGYARAHDGRRPCIWLDALCADATRTEAEQLADLPFVMGRAHGLLLLCGPKTIDRLRCAIELYVWLATGGSVDDVQIALLGRPCVSYPQLVAAFDVYHVMYASVAADASDPAVVEQLMRVVELARVSVFNEKVRSFLPVVREHAARARACAAAAAPSVEDASHVMALEAAGARGSRGRGRRSQSFTSSTSIAMMSAFRFSSSAFRGRSTRGLRSLAVSQELPSGTLGSGRYTIPSSKTQE